MPQLAQPAYRRWQLPSGREWIAFHRDGEDYVLRFPGLADFHLAASGEIVECEALRDLSEERLRHLFDHQVLPFAANLQGSIVLHAGAVAVGEGAIAFVGSTGRGKSTLTAALARGGHSFLTDDTLSLSICASGEVQALPGLPHLRLWSDSEAVVGCAGDLPHHARPCTLRAIYLLGEDAQELTMRPVAPAAALFALVQHTFLLDPESPRLLQAQHDALSALVRGVPVFRMDYARRFEALDGVCRDTVRHARHQVQTA